MGLKDFFTNSSNETYRHNMDLLEDYDLINPMGSPNKLFLKFLKSKGLEIKDDEITTDLIDEFEDSIDSINLKMAKNQREKELIFKNRGVWVNIKEGDEWRGSDLLLDHDSLTIKLTGDKIIYRDIIDIEIDEGSWSKKAFTIITGDDEYSFEINEAKAIPLKEIIEDNVSNQTHDEIDDLLELYSLFDEGKISSEELEVRKALIYSDDRYCTNCGEKLDFDAEFCSSCGEKVED
ncbi:MAG: hypothetical protein IJ258_03875 [Methanobrevibacter sp.]|uniref:hypothetical protein n=1 Tax=Methanobrevibacter sp. TaxID=66852 RepID=UPI0025E6004F|nr:hypothetical protein [Methanobrevibacter sp.]MBQ8017225.1 hypothetical protein [Methanobrevibacter sp.]